MIQEPQGPWPDEVVTDSLLRACSRGAGIITSGVTFEKDICFIYVIVFGGGWFSLYGLL